MHKSCSKVAWRENLFYYIKTFETRSYITKSFDSWSVFWFYDFV